MIRGLCAFPVTPVDAGGVVDTGALQRLLDRLVAAGVDSVGLLGSTGSYAYLDRAQRRRAVEAAVACLDGRIPLLVGVGALRTDAAVALAGDARRAGAQAGLVAPVSYAPLTEDEVEQHCRTVARAGLPLCLYDNPSTTRFAFSPGLIGRLAAVPGIVAAKTPAPPPDAVAGHLATLRDRVPAGFSIGCSVDWHASAALLAGADAWYSVLGGLYPRVALRLARAAQAGCTDEVRQLERRLEPVWQLFRTHGSYRVMHLATRLAGLGDTPPPLPVQPLRGEAAGEVERVLGEAALA